MMEKLKACPYCEDYEGTACEGKDGNVQMFNFCPICGNPLTTTGRKILANRRAAPESKPLTCEGCAYKGKYEAEYEYGYPSPCTACKRRAADNYVRRPEGAPSEGSDKS